MGPALGARRVVPSKFGDHLLTVNKSNLPVENVFETGDAETVYNFRVADWHTYFVGYENWDFEVWFHNACGGVARLQTGVMVVLAAEKVMS